MQFWIKESAIYSLSIECMFLLFDSIIFNSYDVGMLRFTSELVFIDSWPLMDGLSHLEDQWLGLMMDDWGLKCFCCFVRLCDKWGG